MNTFIRFPDTTEQVLSLIVWEHHTAPSARPLPEEECVKNAIGLIPAHTITFGSLPQPGIRMGRKQQLTYVQQNMPLDLLYDEQHDHLQIWHTDKQQIVFAIINQALWDHWLALLKTSTLELVSLAPEWMLIPWHGHSGPGLFAPYGPDYIIRTSRWSGYSSPVPPEIASLQKLGLHASNNGKTINLRKMRTDLLKAPLPANLRYRLGRVRYWQDCKIAACCLLMGIVLFQASYFWQYNTRYQQLPVVENTRVKRTQDAFWQRLQELNEIRERTPYLIKTLEYKYSTMSITVSSLRPCQEISSALKLPGAVVKSQNEQQTCEMTLEISL